MNLNDKRQPRSRTFIQPVNIFSQTHATQVSDCQALFPLCPSVIRRPTMVRSVQLLLMMMEQRKGVLSFFSVWPLRRRKTATTDRSARAAHKLARLSVSKIPLREGEGGAESVQLGALFSSGN